MKVNSKRKNKRFRTLTTLDELSATKYCHDAMQMSSGFDQRRQGSRIIWETQQEMYFVTKRLRRSKCRHAVWTITSRSRTYSTGGQNSEMVDTYIRNNSIFSGDHEQKVINDKLSKVYNFEKKCVYEVRMTSMEMENEEVMKFVSTWRDETSWRLEIKDRKIPRRIPEFDIQNSHKSSGYRMFGQSLVFAVELGEIQCRALSGQTSSRLSSWESKSKIEERMTQRKSLNQLCKRIQLINWINRIPFLTKSDREAIKKEVSNLIFESDPKTRHFGHGNLSSEEQRVLIRDIHKWQLPK